MRRLDADQVFRAPTLTTKSLPVLLGNTDTTISRWDAQPKQLSVRGLRILLKNRRAFLKTPSTNDALDILAVMVGRGPACSEWDIGTLRLMLFSQIVEAQPYRHHASFAHD